MRCLRSSFKVFNGLYIEAVCPMFFRGDQMLRRRVDWSGVPANLQQESWTFWMSELTASQASVVALLSWPSCLCRDSLQRQIFATCLRPKTRPCSWSLLYLCAISVLSLCYLSDICTAFWNTNKKSVLSLCYLCAISMLSLRFLSAIWSLPVKISLAISLLYRSKLATLNVLFVCCESEHAHVAHGSRKALDKKTHVHNGKTMACFQHRSGVATTRAVWPLPYSGVTAKKALQLPSTFSSVTLMVRVDKWLAPIQITSFPCKFWCPTFWCLSKHG